MEFMDQTKPFDFYKYHGLGNDYLVIDPNITPIDLNEKNIQLICDRNFGIGSDGILYGPIMENNQIRLRIFNPDGSEAEKSGNGLRIFSRYLFEKKYVEKEFEIETLGGRVQSTIMDEQAEMIRVQMGSVTFQSEQSLWQVINEKW